VESNVDSDAMGDVRCTNGDDGSVMCTAGILCMLAMSEVCSALVEMDAPRVDSTMGLASTSLAFSTVTLTSSRAIAGSYWVETWISAMEASSVSGMEASWGMEGGA